MRLLAAVALVVGLAAPAHPAAAAGGCGGQVRAARISVGLPAVFDWIAWRESRCNPRAISRSHDYGAWQIHAPGTVAWCARRIGSGSPLEVGWNARCAARLYRSFGYRPWRTA